MKRCIIIGGAKIKNYKAMRDSVNNDDFIIYCDAGLNHMTELGLKPNLIVGDFDSHENPNINVETIVLPTEKDDTDTVFAAKEAIKRGFNEFLLIGVIGQRLDHTLGNVFILNMLDSLGKNAKIKDDYSEMEIVRDKTVYIPDSFSFFSLINITGAARGINIRNAKYQLENAEITTEYQYGISNEVLPGRVAEVEVGEGKLLLIKIF